MTIGKSGQGWMTVLHSDMEKQHQRVFPPHNCCQLSSETDRENYVKKRENGHKVWDWVNSVYPCHMSLEYQFPHCSLVAPNSSSDTKTMNTHTRHTHGLVNLGRQRTHVKQKVDTLQANVRCRFSVHCGRPPLQISAAPHNKNEMHLFFSLLLQCTDVCKQCIDMIWYCYTTHSDQ